MWRRLWTWGAVSPKGGVHVCPHETSASRLSSGSLRVEQAKGEALLKRMERFEGLSDPHLIALFPEALTATLSAAVSGASGSPRTDSEKPIEQIAKDLGVADQTLGNWVKQVDLDSGRRTDGLTTEEREEIRRLRREVRILREERDILRKAAAFFAKKTHSTP